MVQEEVFLKEGVGGGRGAITFPISFFKALFKFRNYFLIFLKSWYKIVDVKVLNLLLPFNGRYWA